MKAILLIIIMLPLLCQGQARLAILSKELLNTDINAAVISNILLKIKGDEWYEKYVLENIRSEDQPVGRQKVSFTIFVDSCGMMKMYPRSCTINEINEGLKEAIKYIEDNHTIIYSYSGGFARLLHENKYTTKQDIINEIHSGNNYHNDNLPFTIIANGWISYVGGFTPIYYDFYVEDEKKAGRNPKSHIEWLKEKIDYYLSLPIKSSLDYGITNEDFCPQQQ